MVSNYQTGVKWGDFEFSANDAMLSIYRNQENNSPIVVIDASDITIDGVHFIYDVGLNKGFPCVDIYGKELRCTNITKKVYFLWNEYWCVQQCC
jgi:hypothetical protein